MICGLVNLQRTHWRTFLNIVQIYCLLLVALWYLIQNLHCSLSCKEQMVVTIRVHKDEILWWMFSVVYAGFSWGEDHHLDFLETPDIFATQAVFTYCIQGIVVGGGMAQCPSIGLWMFLILWWCVFYVMYNLHYWNRLCLIGICCTKHSHKILIGNVSAVTFLISCDSPL